MSIVPRSKPRMAAEEVRAIAIEMGLDTKKYPVYLVGVRGYYLDSMGKKGVNDRGIYDDAIFLVSPERVIPFNASTDPTGYRKGHGFGPTKGMATLKPGIHYGWKLDYHKGQYPALCQRKSKVTVIRDGDPPYEDTGYFGINGHRGGTTRTNSEGCQTWPTHQYDEFLMVLAIDLTLAYGNPVKEYKDKLVFQDWVIPYVLKEGL
jgi:hypothetical protein